MLLWEIFSLGSKPYPSVPVEMLSSLLTDGYRMHKPTHASDDLYVFFRYNRENQIFLVIISIPTLTVAEAWEGDQ